MNIRDCFTGLDDIPEDDPFLRADEEWRTLAGQAFVDGDLRRQQRECAAHAAWQCAMLTRWWHLPPPRWTGVVH